MFDRIFRAIKMDPALYREVAKDVSLMNEAILISVVVAIVSALGGFFIPFVGFVTFLVTAISAFFLGWVLWAFLAKWIGGLQGGKGTFQEMLRALAYASTPRILGFIPVIGWLASIYSLVLGVIAIREVEGFDNTKAIITAVVGWLVYFIAGFIISAIIGSIYAASLIGVLNTL